MGKTAYTVCDTCKGWVFDWKLQKSGGWCNNCSKIIKGWYPAAAQGGTYRTTPATPPWRKGAPPVQLGPADEVQNMLEKLTAAVNEGDENIDLGPLRVLHAQLAAKEP